MLCFNDMCQYYVGSMFKKPFLWYLIHHCGFLYVNWKRDFDIGNYVCDYKWYIAYVLLQLCVFTMLYPLFTQKKIIIFHNVSLEQGWHQTKVMLAKKVFICMIVILMILNALISFGPKYESPFRKTTTEGVVYWFPMCTEW